MILHLTEDRQSRLMEASWGDAGKGIFAVEFDVVAHDRSGLLKDITEILAQEKTNVVRLNTHNSKSGARQAMAHMEFTLEVNDIAQLTRCLARVSQVRGVQSARRK
jgi:GTP pyrophosphokinase